MAGINILDLVEATEVNETNDYLAIVDKSDTTQDASGSTKKVTVGNLLSGMLDWFYPVGTIYETTSSDLDTVEKVNAHFGGTWEFYGAGKVLVAKSADTEFDTIGKTGGEKTVTLTAAQSGLRSHRHSLRLGGNSLGVGDYDDFAGRIPGTQNADAEFRTGTAYASTSSSGSNGYSSSSLDDASATESHNNLQPYIVVYRYRRIS